jgi:hypothetical protein
MISDKQLIREGRYQEALGANYDPTPFYICFTDEKVKEKADFLDILGIDQQGHVTRKEAYEFAEEMKLPNNGWVIYNSNADWL